MREEGSAGVSECVCVRMCELTSLPGIIVEKEETEFL